VIRTGIIGITGYVGKELLKILSKHPNVKITGLYGRGSSVEKRLEDVYPCFKYLDLKIKALDTEEIISNCDVVFIALPHAFALGIVPYLFDSGIRIIDLSADFRFNNTGIYEKWYKTTHTARGYIGKAVYGLSEINTTKIKKSQLISNPGCYPTTVILGCTPAIKNDFVDLKGIIIDSKSGISGAGRKSAQNYFREEHPNFKAYKVAGKHRHIPEIEQELSILSGEDIIISFTPHIIPIERGMLSTIYINIKKHISISEMLIKYKEFYSGRHFIRILNGNMEIGIKNVINTNYCEISIKIDERTNRLIIISVIDNLIKGASGQAVQNMNIMFDLPEITGLI
jgi:N-acetyl-gamma-glutamyl-phosphate reductase